LDHPHSAYCDETHSGVVEKRLLRAKNGVLYRLGGAEFDNSLGRNLDLLLPLVIKTRSAPSSSVSPVCHYMVQQSD